MVYNGKWQAALKMYLRTLSQLRPEVGQGSKNSTFLNFCLWLTLVEADLVEPKLAAKEIAFTQKLRFTFSFEI